MHKKKEKINGTHNLRHGLALHPITPLGLSKLAGNMCIPHSYKFSMVACASYMPVDAHMRNNSLH